MMRRSAHPAWRQWTSAVACVTAALSFAACGHDDDAPEAGFVGGSASELFPGKSLQDWVSYADHVAVYRVVDERALPLGDEEAQSGEGLAGREVVLQVERRLWSAKRAPPLPAEIRMDVFGWVLHDGERRPIVPRGAPRVVPGEHYLAPLALVELDAGPEWWPLTPGALVPVETDTVAPAPWNREISDALSGRSIEEARRAIHATRADPIAAEHSDLRPQERVEAVARGKRQGDGDSGGP
jgi:hypothetical protein